MFSASYQRYSAFGWADGDCERTEFETEETRKAIINKKLSRRKRIKRAAEKAQPGAPHEVILVLDGTNGQNALMQTRAFDAAIGVTGLVITKLDGTAKGGVLVALARERAQQPIPILFVGVGEALDDLQPFNARDFAAALVGDGNNAGR